MAGTRRVTLREASEELGVSVEAVRKRVKRESLRSDKDPDGRVYVYLDAGGDASYPQAEAEDSGLVEELRSRVAFLEEELGRRSSEAERYQQIVAGLAQANAEQARTIRAIEAPAEGGEAEAVEMVEEEPEGSQPRSDTPGPQTAPQRPQRVTLRDLGRRLFGR